MSAGDGIDYTPLSPNERAGADDAGKANAKIDPQLVVPVPEDADEPDWAKLLKADGTPSKLGKPDHVRAKRRLASASSFVLLKGSDRTKCCRSRRLTRTASERRRPPRMYGSVDSK